MNLAMFMALLVVGWNQTLPHPATRAAKPDLKPDLKADLTPATESSGASAATSTAEASSEADPSSGNQKASPHLPRSSRSFAFSTPTREWLRTHTGNASPELLLFPGAVRLPVYLPIVAFESFGRTAHFTPSPAGQPPVGRAPPCTA